MFSRNSVKFDPELFKAATELARKQGYSSLQELLERLLRAELEKAEPQTPPKDYQERLKGLGYM